MKWRENRILGPEKWSRLVMLIRENIVVRYSHFMFYMNTWTDILNVQNIEHGKISISKNVHYFSCVYLWLEFIFNSVNFRNPPNEFHCSQLHIEAIVNSISFRRCIAVSHILYLISVVYFKMQPGFFFHRKVERRVEYNLLAALTIYMH